MAWSSDRASLALGIIAVAGVAIFAGICLASQFIRTDRDWITTPISVYVFGHFGTWVKAGFVAPAPALIATGVGWYRALDDDSRSVGPLLLFVLSALALCCTAVFVTDITVHPHSLHGTIHQWSAFATFVLATLAMFWQSWCLCCDPRWRVHFIEGITLAALAFAIFWTYALLKSIPRGVGEKVVITSILLWLWRSGWWLIRGPSS